MDEAAREQQREARRQKVLARSGTGSPAPVVDLAMQTQNVDSDSTSVGVDRPDDPPLATFNTSGGTTEVKSGARLAAERRRQRILSRRTERMAKVHGDRVYGSANEVDPTQVKSASSVENLSEILQDAEAEVFGQVGESTSTTPSPSPAESKPSPTVTQPFFKSSPGTSPVPATNKPAAGVKSARPPKTLRIEVPREHPGAAKPGAGKRLAGNKALEKQSYDAAVKHLTGSLGTKTGKRGPSGLRDLMGSLRFWVGLEGFTKATLLLMVGAGVGGLLLSDGRAAVAQTEFEAAYRRNDRGMQRMLDLKLNVARDGGYQGGVSFAGETSNSLNVISKADDEAETDEFGEPLYPGVVKAGDEENSKSKPLAVEEDASERESQAEGLAGHGNTNDGMVMGDGSGEALCFASAERCFAEEKVGGGILGAATITFLEFINYLLRSSHAVLSRVMSPGLEGMPSCVPAIFLAVLVRFAVTVAFFSVRVVLGLPAFPPAGGKKPGMVMGMVQSYVPTLGKVIAAGTMVKSILSDTSLLIAGTVLSLTLCLAREEDSIPRRNVSNFFRSLGGALYGGQSTAEDL